MLATSTSQDQEANGAQEAAIASGQAHQAAPAPAQGFVKRCGDVALALTLLPVVLPLAIVIALAVRATSAGPALYWSQRVGAGGRLFAMPKFRTMRQGAPPVTTRLLADPQSWVTPLGRHLRRSSLDELPQLWSVLRGDMSFVGPRPALFNETDLIARRRAAGIGDLVPGITGWAQVNGRDHVAPARKVELERDYRARYSVAFDLRIVAITIVRVLRREGISH